jgi:hypothetical protein
MLSRAPGKLVSTRFGGQLFVSYELVESGHARRESFCLAAMRALRDEVRARLAQNEDYRGAR